MNCPKCGSARVKYDEDRKKFQTHHKGFNAPTPRTNFNATCPDCHYCFNTQEES